MTNMETKSGTRQQALDDTLNSAASVDVPHVVLNVLYCVQGSAEAAAHKARLR